MVLRCWLSGRTHSFDHCSNQLFLKQAMVVVKSQQVLHKEGVCVWVGEWGEDSMRRNSYRAQLWESCAGSVVKLVMFFLSQMGTQFGSNDFLIY